MAKKRRLMQGDEEASEEASEEGEEKEMPEKAGESFGNMEKKKVDEVPPISILALQGRIETLEKQESICEKCPHYIQIKKGGN